MAAVDSAYEVDWPEGNSRVRAQLQQQLATGVYPSVQLFCGPEGVGKRSMARAFARVLLCRGVGEGALVDLHELAPESKQGMYTVAALRDLQEQARLSPMVATHKVFLLDRVERLGIQVANALLKLLEEPPADTLFLLISRTEHSIPMTLRSRCLLHRFEPLSEQEIVSILASTGIAAETARGVAGRARGSVSRARRMALSKTSPLIRELVALLKLWPTVPAAEITQRLRLFDKERTGIEQQEEALLEQEEAFRCIADWARDLMCLSAGGENLCFPEHLEDMRQQLPYWHREYSRLEAELHQLAYAASRSARLSQMLTAAILMLRQPL